MSSFNLGKTMTQKQLADVIAEKLGMSTQPSPPRPEPRYEYTVNVYRTQYGTVTVTAKDEFEALKLAYQADVFWYDCGKEEFGDLEEVDGPVNQDELDEWDEQYGDDEDDF
jgi:hypothetical protein